MEKKEPVKISLPLFITIIVLLVAVISTIFMFMQNQKLDKEIAGLKEQISKTQTEKNELQEKLNSISNTTEKESNQKEEEETKSSSNITVKQKEEYADTIATLYSNNKITIKLKKTEKSQMWKYYVEDWKTAEYDKEYDVNGIEGEISKILLTNFPTSDVAPALIILSEDGTVSYVDITLELHNAFEKKTSIKSFTAKEKEKNSNFVDIKTKNNGSIVAIDKNGEEKSLWKYEGVD